MRFYCKTTDEAVSISDDDWRDAGPFQHANIEIDGRPLTVSLQQTYLHIGTEKEGQGPYIKVVAPSLGVQSHFSEDHDSHEQGIIFWPESMAPMPTE